MDSITNESNPLSLVPFVASWGDSLCHMSDEATLVHIELRSKRGVIEFLLGVGIQVHLNFI
jgi:hypothetical protein